MPIRGKHSERFDVTGYRIGPLAYMTDFKTLLQGEAEKLAGVDTLVVNALRFAPHYSHFDVEEAVTLIREVKPRRAFLTPHFARHGAARTRIAQAARGCELGIRHLGNRNRRLTA